MHQSNLRGALIDKIASTKFHSAIDKLFEGIFSDLDKEVSEKEVGWISPDQIGIDPIMRKELLNSNVIEEDSKGYIRLNFRDYRTIEELKNAFPLQSNQLEYLLSLKSDEIKVQKARENLNKIFESLQQFPEKWICISAIGWWKMLGSSGMPALIDDILNEGFSPEEWTIKAVRCSPELALGVARRLGWNINKLKDAINILKNFKIPVDEASLPPTVSNEDTQKVKKILKWMDIEKELTESVIKTLGLLWFSFFVLDSANLWPLSNESYIKLCKIIWDALEKLLGQDQTHLLNELGDIIGKFDSNKIPWASDIIRIPEVI